MYDGADACFGGLIEPVPEWEEGVGRHHRTGDLEAFVGCLDGGDARAIDATHLTGTDADRAAIATIDDGVGLDVLDHLPGE